MPSKARRSQPACLLTKITQRRLKVYIGLYQLLLIKKDSGTGCKQLKPKSFYFNFFQLDWNYFFSTFFFLGWFNSAKILVQERNLRGQKLFDKKLKSWVCLWYFYQIVSWYKTCFSCRLKEWILCVRVSLLSLDPALGQVPVTAAFERKSFWTYIMYKIYKSFFLLLFLEETFRMMF